MRKNELLKYFLLFIVAFSLFSYFQISSTFPDPDSFYHAKMAVLIPDQGIVRDFPWLQFTVLKDNFADHHFLYHVALIPFVTLFDPLVGIKLFTALSAAVLILVFYWFLKKFKIRGALLYSIILLVSSPFIFRINLAKASAISLTILLFGLYFIFQRKVWPLFFLSFIYVWTYGGWPLILVLALFYIFSESLISVTKNFENVKSLIKNFFKNIFSKTNVKLFFACFGGLAAGVIINPFFPKNLFFYWQQIIKIAVINYQDKIGVGAEWYPYGLGDLIANSSFIFILLILSFAVIFINFLKNFTSQEKSTVIDPGEKTKTLTLTLLALFFLALTLRSRRNVEYFIPFAALASAFILSQPLSSIKKYLPTINAWRQKRKVFSSLVIIYILFMVPFTSARNIWSIKQLYLSGGSIYKYRGVAEWLKNNTPQNSIIFHNDWDDFPALFYYNTNNYYIAGLDPTFMYDYDKDLHKIWVDITTGRRPNISEFVKNDFRSEYVFVDKDHIALENNLKSDGHFEMVYKDEEGKIYKLTEK